MASAAVFWQCPCRLVSLLVVVVLVVVVLVVLVRPRSALVALLVVPRSPVVSCCSRKRNLGLGCLVFVSLHWRHQSVGRGLACEEGSRHNCSWKRCHLQQLTCTNLLLHTAHSFRTLVCLSVCLLQSKAIFNKQINKQMTKTKYEKKK